MRILALLSLTLFLLFAGSVLVPILLNGAQAFSFEFLMGEPGEMGRSGGIAPMIYSTIWINGIAVVLAVVVGLPVALTLSRLRLRRSAFRKGLGLSLDLLAGTPSIVFGLFGYVMFVQTLGLGYSLLSGALTLTLMIVPLFIRLVEDALNELPPEYESIAASLRLSQKTFTFKVLVPAIWPAITTAIVLSWTRAMGETAALLFTAGYSMRTPQSVLDSGRALSVHIFDLSLNVAGANEMAYQSALVLLLMTVAFVMIARLAMGGVMRWRLRSML